MLLSLVLTVEAIEKKVCSRVTLRAYVAEKRAIVKFIVVALRGNEEGAHLAFARGLSK